MSVARFLSDFYDVAIGPEEVTAIIAEHQAAMERVTREAGIFGGPCIVSTDDSAAIARLTDHITDDPSRFATRYLSLERRFLQLEDQVNGMLAREIV